MLVGLPVNYLLFLREDRVAAHEEIELGAEEAMERVLGVHTIGSPRTLKLVFTSTGQPVWPRNGRGAHG